MATCTQSDVVTFNAIFTIPRAQPREDRGGELSFFRRLWPSIYCLPPSPPKKKIKKISGISSTRKKKRIFCNPPKYPHSVHLPYEKKTKYTEITPKTSQSVCMKISEYHPINRPDSSVGRASAFGTWRSWVRIPAAPY